MGHTNAIKVSVDQGVYAYSLDGFIFQNSETFNNLKGGMYTIYGQEINGCGYFQEEVAIYDYPKFFTPNNDNYNDFWFLFGVDDQAYKVSIFDRYGKVIKVFKNAQDRWNGTYNGKPLPATDYWFRITLKDRVIKTGHFTLKR